MAISPKNKYIPKNWTLDMCAFESRKDMTNAMSDPLYGKDQEYTELVQFMANKPFGTDRNQPVQGIVTGRELSAAMYPRAEARKLEDAAIFREQTQKMFSDPRYATSPTYRREVENWIAANSEAIEASPGFAIRDVNQTRNAFRVTLNAEEGFKAIRAERDAKVAAQEAESRSAKHAAIDAGRPTEGFDLGGRKL